MKVENVFEEIRKDEELWQELEGMSNNPAKVVKTLREKGYDISLKDFAEYADRVSPQMEPDGKVELDEDTLDNVVGGGIGDSILFGLKAAMHTFQHPVSTAANVIKGIADNDWNRLGNLMAKIDNKDIYEMGDEVVNKVVDKA